MTAFTVILPHLRNPGNDAALRIALDCLIQNTVNEFTLLMDAVQGGDLYQTINRLVEHAPTECCVYTASDTFMASAWDTPMLQVWNTDRVVLGVVVEPGMIGVHPENVLKDFGRRPDTFRRTEFEKWAASNEAPVPNGYGFIAPFMFSRSAWLEAGGLELGLQGDHHGFTGADEALFERWENAGKQKVRARSYFYHLQRFSMTDEQEHSKRDI